MLFKMEFWPGIASGEITCAYRRWKRPSVIAGRRYRTPAGIIEVMSVEPIDEGALTDETATRAGYPSRAALVADLPERVGLVLYRIDFRASGEADPRDVLAADGHIDRDGGEQIAARLQRLDRASKHGAWTHETLDAIRATPGERAANLALTLGREKDALKLDIRKLKALGLTLSLEVGYELSPRGEGYLRWRTANGDCP